MEPNENQLECYYSSKRERWRTKPELLKFHQEQNLEDGFETDLKSRIKLQYFTAWQWFEISLLTFKVVRV